MKTQPICAIAQPWATGRVHALPVAPAPLHLNGLENGYELEQRGG